MKKLSAIFVFSLLAAMPAVADSYVARARVIESTPVTKIGYEKKEICRYEYITEHSEDVANIQDKLIEEIVSNDSNAHEAVSDVIVGTVQESTNREKVIETRKKVRVCEIKDFPKRIVTGYYITIEHDNRRFSQVIANEPGSYIDINVSVEIPE